MECFENALEKQSNSIVFNWYYCFNQSLSHEYNIPSILRDILGGLNTFHSYSCLYYIKAIFVRYLGGMPTGFMTIPEREENSALRERINELEEQVHNLKVNLADVKVERDGLKEREEELRNVLKEVKEERNALKDEVNELKEKISNNGYANPSEIVELKRQLAEAIMEKDELRRGYDRLKFKVEEAEKKVTQKKGEEYYRALDVIAAKTESTRHTVITWLKGGSIWEEWGLK